MEINPTFYHRLLARPTVIITTRFRNNKTNAAPFSFITPISFKPPYIGFACDSRHDTWRNINYNKEWVINIVSEKIFDKLKFLAKKYSYGVSELEQAGLEESESKVVKVNRIKQAIGYIECQLNRFFNIGDHIFVVGKVVCCDINKIYWDKENKAIDVKKAKPFFHVSNEIFAYRAKPIRVELKVEEEKKSEPEGESK